MVIQCPAPRPYVGEDQAIWSNLQSLLSTGLGFLSDSTSLYKIELGQYWWLQDRSCPAQFVRTKLLLAHRFKIRSCPVLLRLGRSLCYGMGGKLGCEGRTCGKRGWTHAGFHGLLTAIAWRSYEQHWEARTLVLKEAAPSAGHGLPPSHLVSPWPHRFYIPSCPATQPTEIEQHFCLHKRFLICLIWIVLRHRRSSNHESFHWEPSSAVGVV